MKRLLIFLACLILGPILGCLLSSTWHDGANTFWKPIDYFPHPVKTIIVMQPAGREFWVESTENEIYHITYPCFKDEICWLKTDANPSEISTTDGLPVEYNSTKDKCENSHFMYPIFHKVTMCITSATHAPDATHTVSLALTSNNKLWIWDQDYEDPFSVLISMFTITIVSSLIGFFIGILSLIASIRKRKGT